MKIFVMAETECEDCGGTGKVENPVSKSYKALAQAGCAVNPMFRYSEQISCSECYNGRKIKQEIDLSKVLSDEVCRIIESAKSDTDETRIRSLIIKEINKYLEDEIKCQYKEIANIQLRLKALEFPKTKNKKAK